jgi:histidine triad (HIT) family protein
MTYDDSNVFAKILRGELPCHKVYEDDATFAFMDIMPRAHGHTLVIPKAQAVDIVDADPEVLCTTIKTVQKLTPVIVSAMEAEGALIQQFNGAAAGQTVFHVHFHIIPRSEGLSLRPHAGEMGDPEVLAANAEKIRTALEAAA